MMTEKKYYPIIDDLSELKNVYVEGPIGTVSSVKRNGFGRGRDHFPRQEEKARETIQEKIRKDDRFDDDVVLLIKESDWNGWTYTLKCDVYRIDKNAKP